MQKELTSEIHPLQYAKAYFKHFEFDSVTIAPYMGKDSVEPFLSYEKAHHTLSSDLQ